VALTLALFISSAAASPPLLEFKGAHLGDPRATVEKALGKKHFVECLGDLKSASCVMSGITYANIFPKSLRATFSNGRLARVDILVDAAGFQKIRAALAEKYGPPADTGKMTRWSGGTGWQILATELSFYEGHVSLMSAEEAESFFKGARSAKSAKDDL